MDENDWPLLELADIAGNGWELLAMDGNDWPLPKMA